MSALYGSLSGDGRAQPKTRCAHRDVNATSQSWEGSITVSIHIDSNGSHFATIQTRNDSGTGGRELWRGPLSLLVHAERLALIGDTRTPKAEA